MRIIFVGIHNKPGMQPLDSKTKSGKIIDEIIKLLHNIDIECIKINLYDCDYHPTNYIVQLNYQIDWLRKLKPQKYDLVVLLGKLVKNEIDYDFVRNHLSIRHPASLFSPSQTKYFIENTANTINSIIASFKETE